MDRAAPFFLSLLFCVWKKSYNLQLLITELFSLRLNTVFKVKRTWKNKSCQKEYFLSILYQNCHQSHKVNVDKSCLLKDKITSYIYACPNCPKNSFFLGFFMMMTLLLVLQNNCYVNSIDTFNVKCIHFIPE